MIYLPASAGFRSALEKLGGRCRFSCEWDKYSQKTYEAWYGDIPHDDIRKVKIADIPDHDVLAAGFPCQPFSIAGVSKRQSLGMAHGFKCVTQGNLFFQLATIIEAKRPAVLFPGKRQESEVARQGPHLAGDPANASTT